MPVKGAFSCWSGLLDLASVCSPVPLLSDVLSALVLGCGLLGIPSVGFQVSCFYLLAFGCLLCVCGGVEVWDKDAHH